MQRAERANLAPSLCQSASWDWCCVSGLSGLAVPFLEARGVSRRNADGFGWSNADSLI